MVSLIGKCGIMNDVNDFLNSDRSAFNKGQLSEEDIPEKPEVLFAQWLRAAIARQNPEPYAMTLLTNGADGYPEGRVVYLRAVEDDGTLVFFSNYQSNKATQIELDNGVGLLFFWPMNERQIRIAGKVEKAPEELSDAYFESRPRESQIGAWASQQSNALKNRNDLEKQVVHYKEKFADQPVPRPPHWGGYMVKPQRYEFWQGRQSRLHDRFVFEKAGSVWKITRLAP